MAAKVERCELDLWVTADEFLSIAARAYGNAVQELQAELEDVPQYLAEAEVEGVLNPPPYLAAEAVAGRLLECVARGLCQLGGTRGREIELSVESGGCVVSYHSDGSVAGSSRGDDGDLEVVAAASVVKSS
jgi:hypothetical protein